MAIGSKKLAAVAAGIIGIAAIGTFVMRSAAAEIGPTAVVRRGRLAVTLTESGVLRAEAATVYRSPVEGHELEITYLVPEGMRVQPGDILIKLDTTALKTELERAQQALRQSEIELQAADVDRHEAEFSVDAATEGAGVLAVEESRTGVRLAEAKAARLRDEHAALKSLLDKGYITRDELDRSALDLDEAEASADLMRRKLKVLVERTQPAEQQTARLQLARRVAEVERLRPKIEQARAYLSAVAAQIEGCTIVARTPGLVVYEDNLFVMPHRKVRVGDRVTPSQGLVTLPDLRQMEVGSSVREADVHLVNPGQRARIRVDAFPDVPFSGVVTRIGTLARSAADRPGGDRAADEKRFDVTIRLDAASVDLRPEMTARVDLLAAERADALLIPAAALFALDGIPTCYVVHSGRTEPRMVQIGASSDTDVEISAGLRAGDRVALTAPAVAR